jgi:hypothetical protein
MHSGLSSEREQTASIDLFHDSFFLWRIYQGHVDESGTKEPDITRTNPTEPYLYGINNFSSTIYLHNRCTKQNVDLRDRSISKMLGEGKGRLVNTNSKVSSPTSPLISTKAGREVSGIARTTPFQVLWRTKHVLYVPVQGTAKNNKKVWRVPYLVLGSLKLRHKLDFSCHLCPVSFSAALKVMIN